MVLWSRMVCKFTVLRSPYPSSLRTKAEFGCCLVIDTALKKKCCLDPFYQDAYPGLSVSLVCISASVLAKVVEIIVQIYLYDFFRSVSH